MFNTGLKRFETANVDNFTSDIGIKLRRVINKPWRNLLKYFISRKVIIEQYPELEKGKVYIFAANHSFDEDVISTIHTMDRNAYVVNGSSNQTEHNPVFYALWFNGMIFVNRLDSENRKAAVQKMKRILQAGNSVMLFAEGGYNNTENELIMPLFSGPYTLSKELEVEVVPLITFNDYGTDTIYIRAGQTLALWKYEKYEALNILRDTMSTIVYNIMEEHTTLVHRSELGKEPRKKWMDIRKGVYACQKWYDDVWDEELTRYPGHGVTSPIKAREYVDNVHITAKNAKIFADILVRREEDKRYDLIQYMRDTFILSPK